MENLKVFINEKKVAQIRGCGLSTLRNERHQGRGIPYYKDGRRVKYLLSDVYSYMECLRINLRQEVSR